MKQIPECFQTTPIVYAVGTNYQIMVPVTQETLMWAEVSGKCYYDDINGIMRSNCTTDWISKKGIYIGTGFEADSSRCKISFVGSDAKCYHDTHLSYTENKPQNG